MVKQISANQLYKDYTDTGGKLTFVEFLNREKEKGTFPLNHDLNGEVQKAINELKSTPKTTPVMKQKTFLGIPTTTLLIAGAVISAAIVVSIILKNRQS